MIGTVSRMDDYAYICERCENIKELAVNKGNDSAVITQAELIIHKLRHDLIGDEKGQLQFRIPELVSTIYLNDGGVVHGCPWCQVQLDKGQKYCKECGQAIGWGNWLEDNKQRND